MNFARFYSMKDLDKVLQQPKGTAFRLFKANLPKLREGVDFRVLDAARDYEEIEELRSRGRIYRQSVNVVLMHAGCFRWLQQQWREQSG